VSFRHPLGSLDISRTGDQNYMSETSRRTGSHRRGWQCRQQQRRRRLGTDPEWPRPCAIEGRHGRYPPRRSSASRVGLTSSRGAARTPRDRCSPASPGAEANPLAEIPIQARTPKPALFLRGCQLGLLPAMIKDHNGKGSGKMLLRGRYVISFVFLAGHAHSQWSSRQVKLLRRGR